MRLRPGRARPDFLTGAVFAIIGCIVSAKPSRPSRRLASPADARLKRSSTEPRWSGKCSVSLLVGLSVLLWAAIAGEVYLLVRLAL